MELGDEREEACMVLWMASSSEGSKRRSTRRNVTSGVRLMSNPAGGLNCLTTGEDGFTAEIKLVCAWIRGRIETYGRGVEANHAGPNLREAHSQA